jgi:hypothetical protein
VYLIALFNNIFLSYKKKTNSFLDFFFFVK